jgi:hypothetical protein
MVWIDCRDEEKTNHEKDKFERTMTALFRVPKSEVAEKIKKKPKKGKS